MKKAFILLTLAVGFLAFCYFSFRIFISFNKGYSAAEMDWNQDGKTTISEIISGSDVGKRAIILNDVNCFEYYFLKDGLTAKIVCPQDK